MRYDTLVYKDWRIHETGFYAHPDWWKIKYTASHKDYDGPEDNRCFVAATIEECQYEIDEWYEEQELDRRDYIGAEPEWKPTRTIHT